MSEDRDGMMRHHGVTRCPDWCTQPGTEDDTETHESELVTYTTSNGQVVHLQIVTSWWTGDDGKVIATTALDEYGQLYLSIDDWRQISELGDELVAQYDNAGEQWAYDGAQEDEDG